MPRARARLRLARTETPPGPVTRGAASSDTTGGDITAALRRVAEKHAPKGGYGETAWNEGEGTVYWVPADWSSNDEVDAAHGDFMEIDGVNGVVGDAESYLPVGDGWVQVWPIPGSEQAYERVLELATRPLDVYAGTIPASVHYRPSTVPGQQCSTCANFVDGNCTMFAGDPKVDPSYVCDEWNSR